MVMEFEAEDEGLIELERLRPVGRIGNQKHTCLQRSRASYNTVKRVRGASTTAAPNPHRSAALS